LDNNKNNKNAAGGGYFCYGCSKKAPVRVIRRLSVVVGRGFTYCPVWLPFTGRVLRSQTPMEGENDVGRGLDAFCIIRSVSTMLWVGVGVDDINVDDAGSEEQLKFHCYEAHIPYTMQFFQLEFGGHVPRALSRRSSVP
jgi:hypothetical protein